MTAISRSQLKGTLLWLLIAASAISGVIYALGLPPRTERAIDIGFGIAISCVIFLWYCADAHCGSGHLPQALGRKCKKATRLAEGIRLKSGSPMSPFKVSVVLPAPISLLGLSTHFGVSPTLTTTQRQFVASNDLVMAVDANGGGVTSCRTSS